MVEGLSQTLDLKIKSVGFFLCVFKILSQRILVLGFLVWSLAVHPQGTDLLPVAKSRTWVAQRESLLEWARLHECSDRIRSPGSLWIILHQTPVDYPSPNPSSQRSHVVGPDCGKSTRGLDQRTQGMKRSRRTRLRFLEC